MTESLWNAVDELTKPRHVKLWRDDGATEWTTVPSLWWQLEDAAAAGMGDAGGEGGSPSRYRPPGALECLQLHADISDTIVDALRGHEAPPRTAGVSRERVAVCRAQREAERSYGLTANLTPLPPLWHVLVPDSLRALASVLAAVGDDDLTGWWTDRVWSWCRQIINTLRLTDELHPRRVRDTPCPACKAIHVTVKRDGEDFREPALLVDFNGGLIRRAACEACGAQWYRGDDLEALKGLLAEQATRRNHADAVA
jgi:hypothetical protein